MKSKLILLATAAMLVATNAQAGLLTPESQRCTSNRPYGIYKPGSTRQGNCDVAASRADAQWVDQAGRPDETPVGAPGSLVGVPRDTILPLVPKELDAAARDTSLNHALRGTFLHVRRADACRHSVWEIGARQLVMQGVRG
jgi:hypothetical protein